VFVSSTFRDMHAEREELVRRTFPRLRKLCESRGVAWGEVDLRWGITDEQRAEGKVLPTCLAEIAACSCFIGVLGERYGWVPESLPDDLVERAPWLAAQKHRSVTELEILHGALNEGSRVAHPYFYFRDASYVAGDARDGRAAPGEPDYGQRLRELKRRIRESGMPLREDYADPKAFGELVLQDLGALIEHLFPVQKEPDPLEVESRAHAALARAHERVYVRRDRASAELDTHASSEGSPLIVTGDAGFGKSALLANWALDYEQANPDAFVLVHFVGATPESTQLRHMLQRIISELERRLGFSVYRQGAVRDAFADALYEAAARSRIILVLDGLERLQGSDAVLLDWLPFELPKEVRLIVSTSSTEVLERLERRNWRQLDLAQLDQAERAAFVDVFLGQYSKRLPEGSVSRIANAPQTGSPLYLRMLLGELRIWGDPLTLDRRITDHLEARTVEDLYALMLARCENDYDRERPGLVGDALSLLSLARRGLSENELLGLLGDERGPLPGAIASPFLISMEHSLLDRSGLLGLSNANLARVVETRYLSSDAQRSTIHAALAAYFRAQELGPRKLDELPGNLCEGGAWDELADFLRDPAVFMAFERAERLGEFRNYAASLQLALPGRMILESKAMLHDPEIRATGAGLSLISALGRASLTLPPERDIDPSGTLRRIHGEAFLRHVRPAGDHRLWMEFLARNVSTTMEIRAFVLRMRGIERSLRAPARSVQLAGLEELAKLAAELGDKAVLARCLRGQALIQERAGRVDAAVELLLREQSLLGDWDAALAGNLSVLSRLAELRGERKGTDSLRVKQEMIIAQQAYDLEVDGSLAFQLEKSRQYVDVALVMIRRAFGLSGDASLEQSPKPIVTAVRTASAARPSAADREQELNIAYQQERAAWKQLPFWKRLITREPEPHKDG
jgi:hypothetical protein